MLDVQECTLLGYLEMTTGLPTIGKDQAGVILTDQATKAQEWVSLHEFEERFDVLE